MSKKILLTVFYFFIATNVFSQEIKQGLGFLISDISYPKRDHQNYRLRSTQVHLSYNPSFVLKEFQKSSISLGLPVSIGFSILTNKNRERSAGAPVGITTHLPLVFDYNLGQKSSRGHADENGAYFGIGFDYFTFLFPRNNNSDNYGPLLRGGYHFEWGTLGLFYKKSLEMNDKFTAGLSLVRN